MTGVHRPCPHFQHCLVTDAQIVQPTAAIVAGQPARGHHAFAVIALCADIRSHCAAHVQVPGSSTFRSPACGATASGALDAAGALHIWGTDTGFHGTLTEELGQQARAPTPVGRGSFRTLAVGFAAAAAVTRHGRLATWGWSGYAQEVGPLLCTSDTFHTAACCPRAAYVAYGACLSLHLVAA